MESIWIPKATAPPENLGCPKPQKTYRPQHLTLHATFMLSFFPTGPHGGKNRMSHTIRYVIPPAPEGKKLIMWDRCWNYRVLVGTGCDGWVIHWPPQGAKIKCSTRSYKRCLQRRVVQMVLFFIMIPFLYKVFIVFRICFSKTENRQQEDCLKVSTRQIERKWEINQEKYPGKRP